MQPLFRGNIRMMRLLANEEEVQLEDKPCFYKASQIDQQSVREVAEEKKACSHLHSLHISTPPAIRS